MGKESLIKSTAKTKAKKEEKPKKTAAKKKAAKPTAKKATKSSPKKAATTKAPKSTAKKKSAVKAAPKTTVKKPKAKTKAKAKPAAKKSVKKLTTKELLLKTFSPISKLAKPQPAAKPNINTPTAPPFISATDPKEAARLRGLLFQSHNMTDVMAAAKTPANTPEPVATKPTHEKTTAKEAPPIAQEPPPPPTINTNLPPVVNPDPVSKAAKMLATAVGIVILLILMVSYSNSSKYYIEPKDKAIEIWKGRFSPKDKKFFMVLHGTQFSGKTKEFYSQTDVFPLVFSYYLDKADTLLEVPGLPDFDGIKNYLHDAEQYANDKNMRNAVGTRLNNIERMILLYKADVAISKSTVASLKTAMKHLKSAQRLITNPIQEQEIQQKLNLVTSLKAALDAKAPKKEK